MMVDEKLFTHVFNEDQFVDAIAVQPRNSGDASTAAEAPLIAVSVSALESNLWGGGVVILDGITGEQRAGLACATGVSSIAWTGGDRDRLVAGCDNGDVKLLSVKKEEEIDWVVADENQPFGHDDVVTGVAASATEKNVVASCSWDMTVKVWDVTATDKTLTTLDGHAGLIWDITADPSSAHLWATASQDATVQLWDDRALTQAPSSTLSTLSQSALAVDWHPTQSHLLAVGLENGAVVVFDIRAPNAPLNRMLVHQGAIHCVRYSPFESDVLAVGGDDTHSTVITGSASQQHAHVHRLTPKRGASHGDYVRALDWYSLPSTSKASPHKDRTLLLTGSWDHKVRSWNIAQA